ncbi:Ribosomal protein S36 mitochondrial [Trinorchestia longiramus]|nr:Ribosomal protein S36 mitochondrial [Trinorchestia longiramus]
MMASSGTSAFWKTVRPHVPLIRFRKGGSLVQELVRGAAPASAPLPGDVPPRAPPPAGSSSPGVLEEWQVPPRFQRADLTQEEIDCINSGGV